MNTSPVVSSTAGSTFGQQPPPPKTLSCTNCRRRKIRCNKTTNPCLPCQSSGTECIFPTRIRKPRPRQSNPKSRDAELLKRISHLESLVSRIDASNFIGDGDRTQKEDDLRSNEPSPPTRTRRSFTTPGNQFNVHETGLLPGRMDHQFASFIKRQETDSIYSHDGFWTRLSEEIDGLKQLIEGPSDDEDEPYGSTATSPASKYDSPSQFVFDLKVTSSNILIAYPSDGHNEVLFSYYFKNVHPMMAIEHKQTIHIMARSNSELFDPNTGRHKFKSLEASLFAVAFAAVTSMTDEECVEHFDEEREVLVARYKTATEIALQESDFLNSVEIVTLQALIIYIAVMRSHDRSRTVWTFIGLAVRIARAIGLHRDPDYGDPFDMEMRRRVWWTLLVLDTRASEDRGSETMITDGSFDTKLPANINDDDMSVNCKAHPVERKGLTDMSFACITMRLSEIGLKMNFIPTQKDAPILTSEQKEEMIKDFSEKIESVYLAGCKLSDPEHWWIIHISKLFSLKLWLVTQYPLQRRKSTNRVLPRGQSLRTAMAFLNLSEELWQHEKSRGFFWFLQTWVPWHAIAVALAELCAEPTGPLADQSWEAIQYHYNKWSDYVADTKDGMIWRPVKHLLKRAKAARGREAGLGGSQVSTMTSALADTNIYNSGSALDSVSSSMVNKNYHGPSTIGQCDSIVQNSYGGMGFELSMPMATNTIDTSMTSPLILPDAYTNSHWNEFIFGLGTVSSDVPPNPEMWGSFQDYFNGS